MVSDNHNYNNYNSKVLRICSQFETIYESHYFVISWGWRAFAWFPQRMLLPNTILFQAKFNCNLTFGQFNPGNQLLRNSETIPPFLFHFRVHRPFIIHLMIQLIHVAVLIRNSINYEFRSQSLILFPGDSRWWCDGERDRHNNDGMTSTHQPGTHHIQQLP